MRRIQGERLDSTDSCTVARMSGAYHSALSTHWATILYHRDAMLFSEFDLIFL